MHITAALLCFGKASLLPCCPSAHSATSRQQPSWNAVALLQASLLHNVGFKAADFRRLMQTRPQVFASTASTIKGKLVFLQQELGLSNEHLVKVLRKYPMVLDFKIERSLRPSINFLRQYGLTKEELCKVGCLQPTSSHRTARCLTRCLDIKRQGLTE